jgi:hypothetical protein
MGTFGGLTDGPFGGRPGRAVLLIDVAMSCSTRGMSEGGGFLLVDRIDRSDRVKLPTE